MEWQPIETMPKRGAFFVSNKLKEVAFAERRNENDPLTIHNITEYADWTWGEPVTHWRPMPDPPK